MGSVGGNGPGGCSGGGRGGVGGTCGPSSGGNGSSGNCGAANAGRCGPGQRCPSDRTRGGGRGDRSDKVLGREPSQPLAAALQAESFFAAPAPLAGSSAGGAVKQNRPDKEMATINAAASGAAGYGRQADIKGDNGFAVRGEICEGTREQCAVRDGTRRPERTESSATHHNLWGTQLNALPVRAAGTSFITADVGGKPNPTFTDKKHANISTARVFAATPATVTAIATGTASSSPMNWQTVTNATKEGLKALRTAAVASPADALTTTLAVAVYSKKAEEGSSLPDQKYFKQTLPAEALDLPTAKTLATLPTTTPPFSPNFVAVCE